jgi:regulator of replication initiation timing
MNLNKKLYYDYNNLQAILENKNNDIVHLKNQLNDYVENNTRLNEEKNELELIVKFVIN